MIENGAIGFIFAIWAYLATDWQDPLAKSQGDRALAWSLGQTYVAEQKNSREFRLSYLTPQRYGAVQMMWDASITDRGGAFIGYGGHLEREFDLIGLPAYAGASVLTGLWVQGDDTDLGFPIEFRTDLEIGVVLGDAWRIGIVTDHRSNMRIGGLFSDEEIVNSGIESLALRLTKRF